MLLKPNVAQQADLDRLLTDQQDRSSLDYHRWLTPQQFADRFGPGDADISTLVGWLNSQGMKVHDVAHGRQWITFSGAAGDIGRALRTEIHRYQVNGGDHFANATELSIPAAFQSVVAGFAGLDDFYKRTTRLCQANVVTLGPAITSTHGNHYLAPADFATIYDIDPLYANGVDGTGQTIAVVGTSDIFFGISKRSSRNSTCHEDPQVDHLWP